MTERSVIYTRVPNVQPLFAADPLFRCQKARTGAYNFAVALHPVRPQGANDGFYRKIHMNAVRPPAVAGTFYPGTGPLLQMQVAALLAGAKTFGQGRPKAVIAPHAGYVYSG